MSDRYLILDCNFLCYRAFHSVVGLSHNGMDTGTAYGFFKNLVALQEQFKPGVCVFCFDRGIGSRRRILPTYKAGRHRDGAELTKEERRARSHFRWQVQKLSDEWLPRIGFQNVLFQDGYEADDMIAATVNEVTRTEGAAVIVSSDHDLYQCLASGIRIYNPSKREILNEKSFQEKFGIEPKRWVFVKAIAGCRSDNVPGASRIGEATALKFLRGELKRDSAAFKAIAGFDYQRNLELVKLPIRGVGPIQLKPDKPTLDGWRSVADELGIAAKELRRL